MLRVRHNKYPQTSLIICIAEVIDDVKLSLTVNNHRYEAIDTDSLLWLSLQSLFNVMGSILCAQNSLVS